MSVFLRSEFNDTDNKESEHTTIVMSGWDLPASLGDASGCDEYFGEEDLTS